MAPNGLRLSRRPPALHYASTVDQPANHATDLADRRLETVARREVALGRLQPFVERRVGSSDLLRLESIESFVEVVQQASVESVCAFDLLFGIVLFGDPLG